MCGWVGKDVFLGMKERLVRRVACGLWLGAAIALVDGGVGGVLGERGVG